MAGRKGKEEVRKLHDPCHESDQEKPHLFFSTFGLTEGLAKLERDDVRLFDLGAIVKIARGGLLMALQHYYLGCPMWAKKEWVGELFSGNAKPADFLRQYASVFNAVEGNTTFYAMPSPKSVRKWLDDTPSGFRFCFKFPRTISHEKRLIDVFDDATAFLDLLQPLQPRLGPIYLQLPASFGPESMGTLEQFLGSLSRDFQYAVELRHSGCFDAGASESNLNSMLAALHIDRVIFDTRDVHASASDDAYVRFAQERKPKVPVRFTATGSRPIVRFVGHPLFEKMLDHLSDWATQSVKWIAEGKTPYMFIHAPDDFYSPRIARVFHNLLVEKNGAVGTMPTWPSEGKREGEGQLRLL